jgi:RNA polymerase sigma factor (sigma-70 family)
MSLGNSCGNAESLICSGVAAVLVEDAAASHAFLQLINTKVAGTIRRKLSNCPAAAEQAIDDLASHLLTGTKNTQSRLYKYRGEASLDTWMIAVGFKMTTSLIKKRSTVSIDTTDGLKENIGEPGADCGSVGLERKAVYYRKRLLESIMQALPRMTNQQKLVFQLVWIKGLQSAKVAEDLGLSRARISQILRSVRLTIADAAAGVLDELSEETECPSEEMADYLRELFLHVAQPNEDAEDPRAMASFSATNSASFGSDGNAPSQPNTMPRSR